MARFKLVSLEIKWDRQGKTSLQKARLRYYYRNRTKILSEYKSSRGGRDIWGMWEDQKKNKAIEF